MGVKRMIAAATLPTMLASPVIAAGDNPAASLSLRGEDSAGLAGNQDQISAAGSYSARRSRANWWNLDRFIDRRSSHRVSGHRRRRARQQTPQQPARKRLIKPRISPLGTGRGKQ